LNPPNHLQSGEIVSWGGELFGMRPLYAPAVGHPGKLFYMYLMKFPLLSRLNHAIIYVQHLDSILRWDFEPPADISI
jgi:hypothetical protein